MSNDSPASETDRAHNPSVPPIVGFAVVEAYQFAPYKGDTFDPDVALRGIYATREEAEREAESIRDIYEQDDTPEMEFVEVRVQEKTLYRLDELERMDQDSHETLQAAADAVGASMLAEEGIGPLAGDSDG